MTAVTKNIFTLDTLDTDGEQELLDYLTEWLKIYLLMKPRPNNPLFPHWLKSRKYSVLVEETIIDLQNRITEEKWESTKTAP
jgi:hypothetical protein